MNNLIPIENTMLTEARSLNVDLYKQWISYLDTSPKTIETYNRAIKQFAIYLNNNGIDKPQRADIIAYREYLKEAHKPTTVQSYMAAVKLFFRWTERENIYPNVADRVKGAKIDSEHKKDNLTSKQVNKILSKIDTSSLTGKRDYAILSLMVTTGLRTISIVRANIEDIRTVGDDTVLFYQGKGHDEKATYVKIAEPVEEALRIYLIARGITDSKQPLFASTANRNNGCRMSTRSISRIAKTHFIDAGFNSDKITAHSLRHTAATLNLLNGATIEETKQMLDHSNINTTLIYSHSMERAKNNSEKRIAKAIFG